MLMEQDLERAEERAELSERFVPFLLILFMLDFYDFCANITIFELYFSKEKPMLVYGMLANA